MTHSESIKTISAALLIAQRVIGAATKDAVNPFFKSKYADLGSVMQACKEALNEADITVLQPVENGKVSTLLLHASGEWIQDDGVPIIFAKVGDPQAQGSAITYARRYGLQSMLFIPAEDDDAERAMAKPEKTYPVSTPENDVMARKMDKPENQKCPKCKVANMVLNPKTGSYFCEDKCWLK